MAVEGNIVDLQSFQRYLESKIGSCSSDVRNQVEVMDILPIYRIYRDLNIKCIKCEVIIDHEALIFVKSNAENKIARFHLAIPFDGNLDLAW